MHECARQGAAAATQALIAAGAVMDFTNRNSEKPVDLATDETCREVLEHHANIYSAFKACPAALVVAAVVHWAKLSLSHQFLPPSALSLRAYQFEPSFLWVSHSTRAAVVAWARGTFIAQLAVNTPPFFDLPDDCAGDILEYLELFMIREVKLIHTSHSSSPEAAAWVDSILSAAIAVRP
jgi:hypothetical protein